MRYTKSEILNFLKSSHRQRIQIDIDCPSDVEITYDLVIRDWIDDLELLNWKDLSKYYTKVFEIKEHEEEFRNKMLPIKQKTIGDFCEFISSKALKPKVESIKLFGRDCDEAGIFKYLKEKLAEENLSKSKEIKPSSKIQDYMNEFAFKIVEEVNRINPKILPTIKYEQNEFEKQSWKLFLGGFILLILAYLVENLLIAGIGIGLLTSGILMDKIAMKVKANKFEFEGIETFRDLVLLIRKNLPKTKNGIQK